MNTTNRNFWKRTLDTYVGAGGVHCPCCYNPTITNHLHLTKKARKVLKRNTEKEYYEYQKEQQEN